MILRRSLGLALTLATLLLALALMLDEAMSGGDWPGWDEGWVLVVFPLGLPVPVARRPAPRPEPHARRPVAEDRSHHRSDLLWGAALFLVWLTVG